MTITTIVWVSITRRHNVRWLPHTVCERQNICLKIPSFARKTKTFIIVGRSVGRPMGYSVGHHGTFGSKSIVSPIFTILPTLFNGCHEDFSTVARRSKPIIICTASLNTFFPDGTLKLILKKAMFGIFNILLVVYCIQLVVMRTQLHILESILSKDSLLNFHAGGGLWRPFIFYIPNYIPNITLLRPASEIY